MKIESNQKIVYELQAMRYRAEKAEAQRDALAEALRQIIDTDANEADPGFEASPDYWAGTDACAKIAGAALAEAGLT